MKREFAATIFSMFLAGTALAQSIESSELAPPVQNESADSARLRGLIDSTLNERKIAPAPRATTQTHAAPLLQYNDWQPSAELWLDGVPAPQSEDVLLDELAKGQKRYPSYRDVGERNKAVPTAYNWNYGSWSANVGTKITTASPSASIIPDYLNPGATAASGGAGAINGRVEYDVSAWQFYGGTKRELVANPDGTLGVNHNFSGGTFYNLPPSLIGGKIGTGFEVNPIGDAKTRLEYRQKFGVDTEGFLAAERTTPFQHTGPDPAGVNGLKAGINRKF
jgi:hypothetical protein